MLSHAAISGSPKDGVYSQTSISGSFYIVLSLMGQPEEVNLELGHNILSKIEEIISQTPEISPKEIVEMETEEFTNGINLNLLVAKIENQKLSVAGKGGVQAKIFRQNKIINLFSGLPVSGTIYHHDLLLIATKDFAYKIDPKLSVEEIRDAILPEIEFLGNNSHLAALFLKIDLTNEQSTIDQQPIPNPITIKEPPIIPRFSQFLSPVSNLVSHYLSPASRSSLHLRRPPDPNSPTSSRRKILYLCLVILIFLISLIVFQLRSRVLEKREKSVAAIRSQVQDNIDSAHKLAGLNDQIAHNVLLQAKADALAASQKTFGNNPPSDLQQILASLDKEITAVSHINNISKIDLFYDFSLLKSDVKIASVWAHKDQAVVLDTNNGAVYSLNLTTKGAAITLGQEAFKRAKYVDFSGTNTYVWSPDGIILVDQSVSPAVSKLILKPSDKWGAITDLKVFVGNIYLLDKTNNQIWKYQNTELGFLDIAPYLTAKSVDFSNAQNLAIDGAVNVLTSTGNLVRFTAGLPESFKIVGLDGGLKNPVSFFSTDDTQNIYILDSNSSRVVVLDKKGGYVSQYLLSSAMNHELNSSVNLVVSESLKKAFLFSNSKVYTFNLQ